MFFDFDMPILRALEGLRTPFFDTVLGALTHLGSETVFMAVAAVLYWCVSKKKGMYLLCVGLFGTLFNQFAKIVCRIPRPWVRDGAFTIVESARADAAGYSFPSGHTAGIVSSCGCIARMTEKRWLRIVCIALIVLVGFSRLYLGVHYPTDVLFSLVVGAVLVLALWPVFEKSDEARRPVCILMCVLTALALAFALYTQLFPFPADVDAENLSSAGKNAWTLTGCSFGMLVAFWLDKRYVNFDVKAVWWVQLLKAILGLALMFAVRLGLKAAFSAMSGGMFLHAVRYFCVVLFGAGIWPMTFRRFALLGKKK